MHYAFLDEAGDVGSATGATTTVVVAVVVVAHPERLRKAVTRTRKALRRTLRTLPELKASRVAPRLIQKLLRRAVEIGFQAIAVVVDKRTVPMPDDPDDLYRRACIQAVRAVLTRFGPVTLTVDRRYTRAALRTRLNQALHAGVAGIAPLVDIVHRDSRQE